MANQKWQALQQAVDKLREAQHKTEGARAQLIEDLVSEFHCKNLRTAIKLREVLIAEREKTEKALEKFRIQFECILKKHGHLLK